MDSTPRTGPADNPDDDGRDGDQREGPPETPVEATGSTPSQPGRESLREAVHRRMRELDDRRAEEPTSDDSKETAHSKETEDSDGPGGSKRPAGEQGPSEEEGPSDEQGPSDERGRDREHGPGHELGPEDEPPD
ncbi:hypothetical protein ACFVYD_04500 [Streptomyces sp. NPDC058301]|uniref:hypothetical protein n=1 Tax=Streptomyces sp. NPDC058301 TaxID=3346436 RepID=UPI0036E9D539